MYKRQEDYIVEIGFDAESPAIGQTIRSLEKTADEHDVLILGLVRRGVRLPGKALRETIHKNDLLVIKAAPKSLESFASELKLSYSRSKRHNGPFAP